jgi:DNA repair protein RecN (Recombination protein N)
MRELAHGGRPRTGDRKPGTENRKSRPDDGDSPTHQIICITHLSQIAACADHHLQISKDVVDGPAGRQTLTKVRVLDGEARVRELAEMMAGKNATPAVLTHARDLLTRAQKK